MRSLRVAWYGLVSTFVVLGLVVSGRNASLGQQEPGAAQDTFRPVAPKHDLMEWHGRAFDALRLAISKETKEAADHAWLLAELANVNRQHEQENDYRAWAAEVRDAAVGVARAVQAKDFAAARELARKMDATCTACHDKYQ